MNPKQIVFLSALILTCLMFAVPAAFAESVQFDKNTTYDVTYQLSDTDSARVERVTILGTATLHEYTFLIVQGSGLIGGDKSGYVRLDSIRSVVPTGSVSSRAVTSTFSNN